MFCCTLPCLLIAAVVFAGLSYFLYIPLNEGIEDQANVRYVLVLTKLMYFGSAFGEMLGWDTAQNITRMISHGSLSNNMPPQMDDLTTEDFTFDGVPVRLYRPKSAKSPSPCVLYMHGGGWTILNVDIYDETVAEFAVKSGYVFISIDYRLAPENPFPIPFDDSYKASIYAMRHAKEYGIDEKRIAIAGDSAGGNLAAAVALKLSETDGIPDLRFQWLIYPALQAFTFNLPSYIANENAAPYLIDPSIMVNYWCNYIGIKPTTQVKQIFLANNHTSQKLKKSAFAKYVDYKQLPSKYHDIVKEPLSFTGDEDFSKRIESIILNPFFAPLMKADLSKVPPAFVVTANHDVLRDDGLLYAERMRKAGVEVDVYNAPNSIHGFLLWTPTTPKFSSTDDTIDMFVKYARKRM